jgi:UDP-glucose:(heptosyl)LPS alpha-1,3-glucosyltransferase
VSGRRLAFVIHDLNSWGGMERCTLEVARRLSHRWPVDVHAFTLEDPHLKDGWGDLTFHRVPALPVAVSPIRTIWFYLLVTPRLRRARRSAPAGTLVHASGACSLVSDVIQVHFVQAAWAESLRRLPARETMTPRMARASGPTQALLRWYYRSVVAFNAWTERLTFTPQKTYVAVSGGIRQELRQRLRLVDRVHVVYHGVEMGEFHPAGAGDEDRARLRGSLGIGDAETVALLVGALDRKGLDKAMEALASLEAPHRQSTRLLAIGGGDHAAFQRLAERLGVSDRVILLPHQKGIARYFRAADLFVFPTLYEPFGMVILEAMACGLPPIVSRSAGAAELVQEGVSGLLLDDPRDVHAIATAWRRLLDPGVRNPMAAEALAVARLRSWDRVAAEYERILEPLMT